jgi:hypothetical protein
MKPTLSVISFLLLSLLLGLTSQATAETRYVWAKSNNPGPPYTSKGRAARNIQDAIDVSSPGDTVEVRAGTYAENITMTDGVHLVKQSGDTPVIDGGGTGSAVVFDGEYLTGSTLDGFVVINGGSNGGIHIRGTGAGIDNMTTIKNCSIYENSGPGINIDGSVATSAPTIDNNEIYGNSQEGIYIMDAGSLLE